MALPYSIWSGTSKGRAKRRFPTYLRHGVTVMSAPYTPIRAALPANCDGLHNTMSGAFVPICGAGKAPTFVCPKPQRSGLKVASVVLTRPLAACRT